jgi:hypothetical protein
MEGEGLSAVQDVILTRFVGEGADGVVYAIAPLSDPDAGSQVVKFFKPRAFLEMETLHHMFRVDDVHYPDHPLRSTPEERLERLTSEMLRRLDDPHLLFRVDLFRDMLDAAITVLATTMFDVFAAGQPLGAALDVSPVRPWVDDNLGHRISELLDDELIVDELVPFFERVLLEIPACTERWTAEGTYAALSVNPLVNLVGLYGEDFISAAELQHISATPALSDRIGSSSVAGLFDLITSVYFHLKGMAPSADAEDEPSSDDAAEGWRRSVATVEIACDLLEDVADHASRNPEHFVGLARLWKAYALLLEGPQPFDVVEPLVRAALEPLDAPESAPDRHDALLLLAEILETSDPDEAARCLEEATRIREAVERA